MLNYKETKNGGFSHLGMNIPAVVGNRHYMEMLALVESGKAEIIAYVAPEEVPMPYRDKRQARYIAELSTEGTFEKTVGDLMDAIIKAHYGDTAELDVIAGIISQIKIDIPEDVA